MIFNLSYLKVCLTTEVPKCFNRAEVKILNIVFYILLQKNIVNLYINFCLISEGLSKVMPHFSHEHCTWQFFVQ